MAVEAHFYGKAYMSAFNKEIDLDSDTIKVMLCGSGYTPDQDNHRYLSDVTGEISGTGYTAGGQALSNATVGYVAATNTFMFDAANVAWNNASFTARWAVFYDDTTSGKPLICYVDFGEDKTVLNGTFTLNFDSAGIASVQVA